MDTVRITSGEYKGRKIATPGGGTHPMGERERIALFNMIAEYLPGAFVLDAFAGSGALGIEALSRGANFVLFIEKDYRASKIISDNLQDLGIDKAKATVLKDDVYRAMESTTDKFTIVLADPPYDKYDEQRIKLLAHAVADQGGILVLSHPGEPPEMSGLKLVKTHKYAAAHLSVYVK